jgi:hypothetical protein
MLFELRNDIIYLLLSGSKKSIFRRIGVFPFRKIGSVHRSHSFRIFRSSYNHVSDNRELTVLLIVYGVR